jgi:hypothetical protein
MKTEEDITYGPYPLGEVVVTENLRDIYLSIPGEVYDRNPALFRRAIRFMQKKRDLKGESHIFNKCVNAGTNRVAREYVLPVLLGTATIPLILELGPLIAVRCYNQYFNRLVMIRMASNWSSQALIHGIKEVDYVSVAAEGFTFGASALSSLIEIKPFSDKESPIKVGFINKSAFDTSVDVIFNTLGLCSSKVYKKAVLKDALYDDELSVRLVFGPLTVGAGFLGQLGLDFTKKKLKDLSNNIENENVVRLE